MRRHEEILSEKAGEIDCLDVVRIFGVFEETQWSAR